MGIAAIPSGVEIKKLTPRQEKALDKLLKAQRDENTLQTAIRVAVPTLAFVGVAGVAIATTFAYLKDIPLPSVKDLAIDAGGTVADLITTAVGRTDPRTPEFTPQGAGPIPRCQRWASDYIDTIEDDAGYIDTVLLATTQLNIIKNMKAEKCTRPSVIPKSQWDKV